MSERRFKSQVSDVLTEQVPDSGALERWLAPTTESKVEQIPVDQIRDRGWRADVDTTDPTYRALKASIRASGVLQPLLLRPHAEGGFEVVSGARRLRAARDTVQSAVPAVVRELTDVQALVGGSWDAVLRSGLSSREAGELVAQLVGAGMAEAQASALVSTAPVREEAEAAVEGGAAATEAVVEAPVAAAAATAAVADTPVADAAAAEAEVEAPVADAAAAEAEVEAPVADAAAAEAVAEAPVADAAATVTEAPVIDSGAAEAVAEAPIADAVEAAAVAEPSVTEAVEVEAPEQVEDLAVAGAETELATVVDDLAQDAPTADVEIAAEVEAELPATAEATTDVVDAAPTSVAELDSPSAAISDEAVATADIEVAPEVALESPSEVDAETTPIDLDATGWPAPEADATRTAPTTPPAAIPVDPAVFPVPVLEGDNGGAAVETPLAAEAPAAAAPEAEAAATVDATTVGAPEAEAAPVDALTATAPGAEISAVDTPSGSAASAEAPAETAAAEVPAVEVTSIELPAAESPAPDSATDASSTVASPAAGLAALEAAPAPELGAPAAAPPPEPAIEEHHPAIASASVEPAAHPLTPHVIPIKLPEPAVGVPAEEPDGAAAGSLPVAAPTAAEPTTGSRLATQPVPAVRMQPTTLPVRPAAALPSLLRRGPLFYAVLGIGLAVGAIVFILVTVVEGVGSGTTPIIAAVVVAVLGFVSAMISLARPRERR